MVALSPSVQLPVDSECFEADQVHEPEDGLMGSTALARAKAKIETR